MIRPPDHLRFERFIEIILWIGMWIMEFMVAFDCGKKIYQERGLTFNNVVSHLLVAIVLALYFIALVALVYFRSWVLRKLEKLEK